MKRKGTKIIHKRNGRWFINCRNGDPETWARIVYQNYYLNGGEIPEGHSVHHEDENPENDMPENLELLIRGDHRKLHWKGKSHSLETLRKMSESRKGKEILKSQGENCIASKLKEKDVIEIRKLLEENISIRRIANIYKVSYGPIQSIRSGKTWKCIDNKNQNVILNNSDWQEKLEKIKQKYGYGNAKLKEKDVKEIKNLLREGLSFNKIAKLYGISRTSIFNIKTGKTWNSIV